MQISVYVWNDLMGSRVSPDTANVSVDQNYRATVIPSEENIMEPVTLTSVFEPMKSERARLDSFSRQPGWTIQFIKPEDLARAGFFFLQNGDKVECAFCTGVLGKWEHGDNPMSEHRRHFPRCPFILGQPVGNAMLGDHDSAVSTTSEGVVGVDVRGIVHDIDRLTLAPNQPASVEDSQSVLGNANKSITSPIIRTCHGGPAHPRFVTAFSRIKTFKDWPLKTGQTPEAMAMAGFFYIGQRDYVKCFYCDGGLKDWQSEDDPWTEHARWFSNCTFVILNKGGGFVDQVKKSNPPVVPRQYLNSMNLSAAPDGDSIRQVSDQEIRELIDTPIVQAVLDMGVELPYVKRALQRQLQQTGHPFQTTEALLEIVMGWDTEYKSDSDSETNGSGPNSSSEVTHSSPLENFSEGGDGNATMSTALESNPPSTIGESGGSSAEFGTIENDKDENAESSIIDCNDLEIENDLKDKFQKVEGQILCKICMDNDVAIVFLPCGHLISCISCATALSSCGLCRQPIHAIVKTFLS